MDKNAGLLSFSMVDVAIVVRCQDPGVRELLTGAFGQMATEAPRADVRYSVVRDESGDGYHLMGERGDSVHARDAGELLFLLEKDATIALQHFRPQLLFLHAASLERGGRAILLVAESGGGKSTTAWALLHHGFRYLSDELAPVDPDTLAVHPYPHALCLKADPPRPYPLPGTALRMAHTIHVPVDHLPSGTIDQPLPLRAVFFLHYQPEASAPAIRRLAVGESAARLVPNVLNGLAHPGDGLDGAIRIAQAAACFELRAAELKQTCLAVHATVDALDAA